MSPPSHTRRSPARRRNRLRSADDIPIASIVLRSMRPQKTFEVRRKGKRSGDVLAAADRALPCWMSKSSPIGAIDHPLGSAKSPMVAEAGGAANVMDRHPILRVPSKAQSLLPLVLLLLP